MNQILDNLLAETYSKHRNRDRTDLFELFQVAQSYENFRDFLSWDGDSQFSKYSVLTGRALSNICFDLTASDKFTTLSNSNSSDFKNGFIFFLGHRGGMCNRLRAIAALSFASKKIGCEFGFSWVETESCKGGVLPHRNFSNRISPVIYRQLLDIDGIIIEDNPATAWHFFQKFKDLGFITSWKEFNEGYILESSELLNTLLEKADCLKTMQKFALDNRLTNYTALHIRRTDFVEHFKNKHPTEKLPDVSDYINYIKENCPNEKFFLSTDDIEVRDKFVFEFGDKVCFFDFNFETDKLRQTSFNHSLLDLAILSKGRRLVTTPRSSFSDYAASISNAEIIKL